LKLVIAAFALAGLTTYFYLFTSPATNFKIAYIEKEQQHYKVTVRGKRVYMEHDLFSQFSSNTYEDSAQYIIPRDEGVIKGQELPTKKGYYNSVGDITIKDGHLKIDLTINNYDAKTLLPDTWNGDYKLIWRHH
jgi:3-polyprenyl-4-hydroxybenzoate decarboxylase